MAEPLQSPADAQSEDVLERLSRLAQAERASLAALARSEGLTAEDAVDAVQEGVRTLLDLLQKGQVEAASEPVALLRTIVRNLARNFRRRHFRARPHDDIDGADPVDERASLSEEILLRAEQTVRLRACVAELCDIQRAVVTLRLLEEREGEDVAQLLGISKNHAAVLLHRAKASLRDCMLAVDDELA